MAGLFFSGPLSGTFTPPPPVITGVGDNTTGSNTIYVGQSDYLAIFGSALIAWGETPTPTITGDDSAIPLSFYWGSDSQVNVHYTVGNGARTGQHSVWVTTEAGKSNAGTYMVYDPTPVILSITPSPWQAGTSTPVTISGSGFGTSPTVSVNDANVLFAAGSVSDTTITGTVTINGSDPGGTATVTVTSNGYGSGFQGATGQSRQASKSVAIKAVTPTVVISGGNNYVLYGSDNAALSYNLVQAQGTPSGGQYTWSVNNPNRLTISTTGQPGVVQLRAVNPSASLNDTALTANYTYGGVAASAATKSTTVTIYRYLTQSGSYNPISLSPPSYGYYGTVYYKTFVQPGKFQVSVSGLPTYETVNQISSNFAGAQVLFTASGTTDLNGNVIDQLAMQSDQPLPANLSIVDSQTIAVEGIYVRGNRLTFSNSSVTITNNGPYN